jgi:phage terminase large subunit-like protein
MSQALARASVEELIEALARQDKRQGKIKTLFPDTGPLRRSLYPKHMHFFALGLNKTSRLAMAANGVGKTFSLGGFETACHLTGQYPDWWPGHRYERPTKWWIAGKTRQTTRDNQQSVLLGSVNAEGEGGGLIPTDCIEMDSIRRWPGAGGLIEQVRIKHASGGYSSLGVRSYDQGLDAFFGANLDGAWMDEPVDEVLIYSEIMARFRGSDHPLCLVTFTPKHGATGIVILFTEEDDPSRSIINITWDEVPHLSEQYKRETLANTPPYMRDTVSKGIPALGVGAVYPIPEDTFVVEPFEIPSHWPRCAGFDGGWHNTACIWGAWNRDEDCWYLYTEHKAGQLLIPVHAAAIKAKGDWIPIVGDIRHTNVNDGTKMIDEYRNAGVKIFPAKKPGKDAKIEKVRTGLSTGKVKVFKTLTKWLEEYRMYHYDDHGKIVKVNDHAMDATQYLIDEGPRYAKTRAQTMIVPKSIKGKTFGRRI